MTYNIGIRTILKWIVMLLFCLLGYFLFSDKAYPFTVNVSLNMGSDTEDVHEHEILNDNRNFINPISPA